MKLPVKTLEGMIRLVSECVHGRAINERCKECIDFEAAAREMFAPVDEEDK
jgi:hypothetical protein